MTIGRLAGRDIISICCIGLKSLFRRPTELDWLEGGFAILFLQLCFLWRKSHELVRIEIEDIASLLRLQIRRAGLSKIEDRFSCPVKHGRYIVQPRRIRELPDQPSIQRIKIKMDVARADFLILADRNHRL